MRITTKLRTIMASLFVLLMLSPAFGQRIELNFPDAWGENGYNLVRHDNSGVRVIHSIPQLAIEELDEDGTTWQMIDMEGIYLPNNEGAPNLPGNGRYIAIPQGATATLRVHAVRQQIVENVDFLPAPQIPLANDDSPLRHEMDMTIYSQDAFYPAEPFLLSEPTTIRGIDVVMLGITPFQYNPVRRELIIYHDIDVEVEFSGGAGKYGDERLRSRWWDPIIMDNILNSNTLPQMDYGARYKQMLDSRSEGYEYIVVVPDHPDFIAWADSIRVFRNTQGISTQVVTTTEIGGNSHVLIRNYIANAYNNWDIAPAAVLFLADYGNTGTTITSQTRTDHPYGGSSSYISDLYYVDMNNNHLPDITMARITARHAADLQIMVPKFINYERNPPTNMSFYSHPVTAMGWQTERWFQICSETVNGFWEHQLNKEPLRQNNIYSGSPGSIWSSNSNTSMVVNVFGPNGLGYIPATPAHLHGFGWTANATSINNAINSGAFMVMHRDHGLETGWGEPHYRNTHLGGLTNEDLTFIFSINCLTGKFNWSGESFTEAIHRHQHGALGVTAASEISYSFVNDTYVWGLFDNMWPDFMPQFGTNPTSRGILPAFGNSAGKYFLQQSNWPSNPQHKQITHYLFHHHGDAFSTVYSQMPQHLSVAHPTVVASGIDAIEVTANEGALIAISQNGELIGVGEGTGEPVAVPLSIPDFGSDLLVTVTMQNYYRYEAIVSIGMEPGDSNCDGVVDVLDAITTVNYVMGNNPQPFCFPNADVTEDGIINVLDIIATVSIIMGN
jgi:hypothetical protein